MNFYGIGVSSGVSEAVLRLIKLEIFFFTQEGVTLEGIIQVEQELQYVNTAIMNVMNQFEALSQIAAAKIGRTAQLIVEGHRLMVSDQEFQRKIGVLIVSNKMNAELAIWRTINEYVELFNQNDSAYLRARSSDFIHVSHVLISEVRRIKESELKPKQSELESKQSYQGEALIAMGEGFSVEDLILLNEEGAIGVIDFLGEEEGHVSVIAKSLGLPMIIHMDATLKKLDSKVIRMDGMTGVVSVE